MQLSLSWRRHLNLLSVLMRMNLRSSDYNNFLGILWSFMGPLLAFLIVYFIFVDRFGQAIPYFPLQVLTGIICLTFFNNTVQYTMRFLGRHSTILLSSRTPSEILLLASLVTPMLKLAVEILVVLAAAAFCGILKWFYLPVILLLLPAFLLLVIGIGLILHVLSCFAGDIEEIWTILTRFFIFLSPVFYTLDMLSPFARGILLYFNPLTSMILSFQGLITGQPLPFFSAGLVLQAFLYSVVIFAAGYSLFKRFEKQIVEIL